MKDIILLVVVVLAFMFTGIFILRSKKTGWLFLLALEALLIFILAVNIKP